MTPISSEERIAVFRDGRVELSGPVDWPSGTRLTIKPIEFPTAPTGGPAGPVIIAGFGLAGRCVADLLERGGIDYVVVDQNPVTVETQACLGRRVLQGDVSQESTQRAAGIESASILALTVPDEQAVLRATALARRLRPGIYIIARTTHTTAGLRASQMGADEVIKAEQAVALQFYERMRCRLSRS